ncbi:MULTISPECIES: hypothetical protein [Gammaproteobacteria]|uniref:hypothetical protein n=1 Tax=Gammaproteobacteria TaxID=1236 RepID=UPI000791D711|nr:MULTISPECIES: hypothetical protein [Gammaproteobacteria]EAO5102699.1 hypothetical protein [Salmonella enterica]ECM3357648.1 hypothetical protein [Salmonella enterica subsp. enterica serovar Enteritidis]ECX0143175.1 hypothetical protein [Salmonella enterica subsp. enterica serovar Newport]EEC5280343.1 hypothetical protein [Salmonella enterica subsp. enterica serovar Potsdam]EHY1235684.1 hypothetical protein [Escherichia coli]
MNTLFAVAMLFGMFATGIGFWALGQWLRGRGHGDRLDKIDATLSKGQRNVGRFLGPLGGGFVGVARSLSRVPFLGNRRSREMWDDLEEAERQRRKDRT